MVTYQLTPSLAVPIQAMPQAIYSIVVKTSDVFNAGTDANVFVALTGDLGSTPPFQLQNSINHRNKFERKHSNVFVFPQIQSLGDIEQVRIWHDNTGPNPAWHLETVEVHDGATNIIYTFPCQRWLAKTQDDGQLNRVLSCSKKRSHIPKHIRIWQENGQSSTLPFAEYNMPPVFPSGFLNQPRLPPLLHPIPPVQTLLPYCPIQQHAVPNVFGSSQQISNS